MEGESETLLATMTDSLKVSDKGCHSDGQNTMEQEEDCFYDCEETIPAKTTSPAQQKTMNHTGSIHSEQPDQGAGGVVHEALQPDGPRDPDDTDYSDSAQVSESCEASAAEHGHDSREEGGVLRPGAQEEQETWENVVEEEETKTDSDSEFKEVTSEPCEFDEEYLREAEKNLTEEEKEGRRVESMDLKETGNAQFKSGEHEEAEKSYTAALALCPVSYSKERSILFSNRAAARLHLDKKEDAIRDCSKAIELNPSYVRAILRRAELYEKTDKLDEALEDYRAALEKDPSIPAAREACMRLPRQIEERNEKLKEEMLSKLKDLGNMVLRPFGLSTSNFQVNQDANTGSYSINFVQNPNNNKR